MSDSSTSSGLDGFDMHLSSLTVGEFRQRIERNNVRLQVLTAACRFGFTVSTFHIWNASTGHVMPDDMRLESFLNVQINAENQARRAKGRRSGSPICINGACSLQAIVTDGTVLETLTIEYTPAPGFVYVRR